MPAPQIDLSTGLVPKAPPGMDLSSGFMPKMAASEPIKQPSVWQTLTQPTEKTDQEYRSYTGPAGVVGATAHGLSNVAQNTLGALKGAVSMFNPKPQPGENPLLANPAGRMLRGLYPAGATQIPAAIHDINQSPDPLGHYAQAAEDTAGQGAGQALTALAGEGVTKGVPYVRQTASLQKALHPTEAYPSLTAKTTKPAIQSELFDRAAAVKQHLSAVRDNYQNYNAKQWQDLESQIDPAHPEGVVDANALRAKTQQVLGNAVKTEQSVPGTLSDILNGDKEAHSWAETRQMRSQLGREIFGRNSLSGEAKAAGKQVYGYLTDQMRNAAEGQGIGEQFDVANQTHQNYINDFLSSKSPVAKALNGNTAHTIVGPLSNPSTAELARRTLQKYGDFGANPDAIRGEGERFQNYKSGLPEQAKVSGPLEIAGNLSTLGIPKAGYNFLKRVGALRNLSAPDIETPIRTPKPMRAQAPASPEAPPQAPEPITPVKPPVAFLKGGQEPVAQPTPEVSNVRPNPAAPNEGRSAPAAQPEVAPIPQPAQPVANLAGPEAHPAAEQGTQEKAVAPYRLSPEIQSAKDDALRQMRKQGGIGVVPTEMARPAAPETPYQAPAPKAITKLGKKPNIADAYMNEVLNYGGEPTTRANVIRDLQAKGLTPEQVGSYLQGQELGAKIRDNTPAPYQAPAPKAITKLGQPLPGSPEYEALKAKVAAAEQSGKIPAVAPEKGAGEKSALTPQATPAGAWRDAVSKVAENRASILENTYFHGSREGELNVKDSKSGGGMFLTKDPALAHDYVGFHAKAAKRSGWDGVYGVNLPEDLHTLNLGDESAIAKVANKVQDLYPDFLRQDPEDFAREWKGHDLEREGPFEEVEFGHAMEELGYHAVSSPDRNVVYVLDAAKLKPHQNPSKLSESISAPSKGAEAKPAETPKPAVPAEVREPWQMSKGEVGADYSTDDIREPIEAQTFAKIQDAPSYGELKKTVDRSRGRLGIRDPLTPEQYLEHIEMNSKSALSAKLKSLQDAVAKESGIPLKGRGNYRGQSIDWHKISVQEALASGKPVPSEVLKDYPDLKPGAPAEVKTEAAPLSKMAQAGKDLSEKWKKEDQARKAKEPTYQEWVAGGRKGLGPGGITKARDMKENGESEPEPSLEKRALAAGNVQRIEPSVEVPKAGNNFEGRYVQNALEPAKEAWDKVSEKYDKHSISWNKITEANLQAKDGVQVNMHAPEGNHVAALSVRKTRDGFEVVARGTLKEPAKNAPVPSDVWQTLNTTGTLAEAKKNAEARLRSGQVYSATEPWYGAGYAKAPDVPLSKVRPYSGIDPTSTRPTGFDQEKLLIKVPNDGTFVVPNNPASIARAMKATENFSIEKEPTSFARRVPKSPAEYSPEKHIVWIEKEIADLQDQIKKANTMQKGYFEEQLQAAQENLAEAKRAKEGK